MFQNMRIWFEKTGSARYISHLDLTRCMARALKLSGLPVWYTEGFNPRIYMSFAMPLSLGAVGERECMDIRLTGDVAEEEIADRLNRRLPRDVRVWQAAPPEKKFDEIVWADYEIFLECENSARLLEKLEELLSRPEIPVTKHGKKGDKQIDIKLDFAGMACNAADGRTVKLAVRLPCSVNGSVNPGLLLDALQEEVFARIVRKRLLTEDFSEIR